MSVLSAELGDSVGTYSEGFRSVECHKGVYLTDKSCDLSAGEAVESSDVGGGVAKTAMTVAECEGVSDVAWSTVECGAAVVSGYLVRMHVEVCVVTDVGAIGVMYSPNVTLLSSYCVFGLASVSSDDECARRESAVDGAYAYLDSAVRAVI